MLVSARARLVSSADFSLLLLRLFVATVLIAGSAGILASEEALRECAEYWARLNVALPYLVTQLSVGAQFVGGILLFCGLGTRLMAGLALANYGAAAGIKHTPLELVSAWPAVLILLLCAHFAFRGGGNYSFDRLIGRRVRIGAGLAAASAMPDAGDGESAASRPSPAKRPGLY